MADSDGRSLEIFRSKSDVILGADSATIGAVVPIRSGREGTLPTCGRCYSRGSIGVTSARVVWQACIGTFKCGST